MSEREFDEYVSDSPGQKANSGADQPPAPKAKAATGASGLGSLAQKARQKNLKSARGILIAIGVITVLVNFLLMALVQGQVDKEIEQEIAKMGPGAQVDRAKLQELRDASVRTGILVNGGFTVMGFIFIGLGIAVSRFPVPATVLGLVLYLGGAALTALFNPAMLVQGIIVKIIIVVFLVNAIKSAVAYQREQTALDDLEVQE